MRKITKEIRQKTLKELLKETDDLKKEISKLKLEWKVNPPKDTNALYKKRKRLSVILTVIGEQKEVKTKI